MAEEDRLKELKKLSPEERIEKLKEIAKKDQEEIEKAHDLIKKSEEEIEHQKAEKRQIPIPQLRSVDVGSLFGKGTQEEIMFKAKRYGETRAASGDIEEKEIDLEKTIAEARVSEETAKKAAQAEEAQRQYQLSMTEITNKATNIYEATKQSDYVSSSQMQEVSDMYSQLQQKMDDIKSGEYNPDYKSFAEQKSAFSSIIKALTDKYHGR